MGEGGKAEDMNRVLDKIGAGGEAEEMDQVLEKMNKRRWWIWGVFFLCSYQGLINAQHIMLTLFFSHIPPYWCRVLSLEAHNWTSDQIRNISSPNGLVGSSCFKIDWNYTELAGLGYQEALTYVTTNPQPGVSPCEYYSYLEEVPQSSTVTEWDLVCDRLPLKSNIQSSIAFGKFVGGFLFGFVADKYGRKVSFNLAATTYFIMGTLASFVPSYWLFIFVRFFIGLAGAGCYEATYTLLTELASKDRRAVLGSLFNLSYPVGYITLSLIAYTFRAWRSLQLAVCIPMLVLLLPIWLLPESPRWLLTQGRKIEAWAVVKKIDSSLVPPHVTNLTNVQVEEGPFVPFHKRLLENSSKVLSIFTTFELCRRICICYFTWFSAALSYYVLALNADNFSSNRYIYLALSGLAEAPSYFLPLFILLFLGRKSTASILFFVSGTALISILLISQDNKSMITSVALLGRFADSAVFAIIILHTSELFPTSSRNTAIGTSLAVSQLGSILAPYVVDILGKHAWYMPSTLCGVLALSSALLILLLPETRGKPLMETEQDLKQTQHNRVSLRNCCIFS